MQDSDCVRVNHIINACESLFRFTLDRKREDLDSDEMFSFAVVRAVKIIGEAASKITKEGRDEISGLPWQEIIGMRNRLAHGYFDINHSILWATIQRDIPAIYSILQKYKC